MGEALLGTSPDAEREARMLFWTSYMRSYASPSPGSAERGINLAREAYFAGRIEVEEFERWVELALKRARSPQP
jgi:hypothetical protein